MSKVRKLVLLTAKMEDSLSNIGKLKLARQRLIKTAGLEDPKAYGKESFVQKDNSKESSKQTEDKDFKKRQTEIKKEESAVK